MAEFGPKPPFCSFSPNTGEREGSHQAASDEYRSESTFQSTPAEGNQVPAKQELIPGTEVPALKPFPGTENSLGRQLLPLHPLPLHSTSALCDSHPLNLFLERKLQWSGEYLRHHSSEKCDFSQFVSCFQAHITTETSLC